MKILFISSVFYPQVGGIEINSEILARGFVQLGADVRLVTKTKNMNNDDIDKFPFKVIRNPNILYLIKEFLWADVVFVNHLTLRLAFPLFFLIKKNVIAICGLMLLNGERGSGRMFGKLKKWRLYKANAVISISEKVRVLSFNKSIVIGNPYRSNLFKNYNIKKKDFVFLGRLCVQKGCDMAIEVLRLLNNEKKNNYNLTIIGDGDGDEIEKLHNMVNKYELNQHLCFKGLLVDNELVGCLNEHKYLLVPSRGVEGFGNVVLEGMACGCLPFVSDDSGLVDAIGNAGVTFKKGDIQSMYYEIKQILNDTDLEQTIRNNATSHLNTHAPEYVTKLYYDVITSVVDNKYNYRFSTGISKDE
ncbi:hypothetical protein FACS189438_0270 [Bacteroidia bacterium]|nr:hypothetical protein FACS189438_0270 [Bacteroidia bacterium]